MKTINRTFLRKRASIILSACAIASIICLQSIQAQPVPRQGHNMPKFADFDRNNDGVLTPDEFSWGQQQHMQKRMEMMRKFQNMGMRQGPDMNMRRGMDMRRGMGGGRNMPRFEDFDQNRDGYISEQELIEARSMRISDRIQQGYQMRNTANISQFPEIDTNADGRISPEEFSAQQKRHQAERQGYQAR